MSDHQIIADVMAKVMRDCDDLRNENTHLREGLRVAVEALEKISSESVCCDFTEDYERCYPIAKKALAVLKPLLPSEEKKCCPERKPWAPHTHGTGSSESPRRTGE